MYYISSGSEIGFASYTVVQCEFQLGKEYSYMFTVFHGGWLTPLEYRTVSCSRNLLQVYRYQSYGSHPFPPRNRIIGDDAANFAPCRYSIPPKNLLGDV